MGVVIESTPWSIYVKPDRGSRLSLRTAIPGFKVNPETGWIRLPLTPFMADLILRQLRGQVNISRVSPDVLRLASLVNDIPNIRAVIQNVNLSNLPDPPSKTSWWSHQKQAFYFLKAMFDKGFRGVGLFSDLGTGKSKVAVGLADALNANLIMCVGPRSSTRIWHQEFRKHSCRDYQIILPDITVNVAERLRRVRTRIRHTNLPTVVVINYDAVWRPPFGDWVLEQTWDLVIADELHRIKTHNSKSSLFMAELRDRAKYRIGLTGTPLHHKPLDIWAQYRFLDPGVYGLNYWDFERYYSSVKGSEQTRKYKHEEEFTQKLYSISFRVSGDILNLPDAVHKNIYGSLGEASELYQEVERGVIAEVKSGLITIHNAFVRLMRLQQITSGHIRDDQGNLQIVGHEKEELFDDFLDDLPEGEPLVVFAEFHYDLDSISKICKKHGLKYSEYSGRRDDLEIWKNGNSDVLAVQMRTGAQSIDLTRARYAVYYSFGLSLGDYQQSLKRIHRAGQKRSVTYIHLILQNTIDERKMKYLERQSDIIQGLLEEYSKE